MARRRIELTEAQRQAVEFEAEGHLLVRGEAGSGKTTVLAARADWIQKHSSSGRMLFVTYNRALAAYVDRILKALGAHQGIGVRTFHEWCGELARALGAERRAWIGKDEATLQIQRIIGQLPEGMIGHRLARIPAADFWFDEMQWLFGRGLSSAEEYRDARRVGRGTAIQVRGEDRGVVWEVFTRYTRWMRENGSWDLEDPAGLTRWAIEQSGGTVPERMKYDHIFIDEVQDFDLTWLREISGFSRTTLTLAGDLAQRIYKRSFSWREANISVTGNRSVRLPLSHRTTKQIMEVAIHLASNPDLIEDEDYVEPTIPDREGPPVGRIVRKSRSAAVKAAVARAITLRKENRKESVVVAAQFRDAAMRAVSEFRRAGASWIQFVDREELANEETLAVTTFHQLKGLEFDHVILLGLEDSTMPEAHLERLPREDRDDEEPRLRRLVYTALTRARVSATICGIEPMSRFFSEVPEELFVDV